MVIETRQYAKRQRTWFRHQLAGDAVRRLDPDASGWQEIVDRWMSESEMALRTSMHGTGEPDQPEEGRRSR